MNTFDSAPGKPGQDPIYNAIEGHTYPETLLIALSTYPYNQDTDYVRSVKESFSKYRESVNTNFKLASPNDDSNQLGPSVYDPIVYHLFGSYDVAFITLVDSYKVAQRLFIPDTTVLKSNEQGNESNIVESGPNPEGNESNSKKGKTEASFGPNSYQVITGMLPEQNGRDKGLVDKFNDFKQDTGLPFIAISHIKLNNGLLIGNGLLLMDEVYSRLDKVKDSVKAEECEKRRQKGNCKKDSGDITCNSCVRLEYIFIQSFSWSEICLLSFSNDMGTLASFITALRYTRLFKSPTKDETNIETDNNPVKSIALASLYYSQGQHVREQGHEENMILSNEQICYEIDQAHLFADTHSYFGVKFDLFENPDFGFKDNPLSTEIEWQIQPGHLPELMSSLESEEYTAGFQTENVTFIAGKSDYLINDGKSTIESNHALFLELRKKNKSKILRYIRKIKTRVQFPVKYTSSLAHPDTEYLHNLNWGKHLIVSHEQIKVIRSKLKRLQVSRHIREQVLKVFHNFNTGIQDSVLSVFHIDFYNFITRLLDQIENASNEWETNRNNPGEPFLLNNQASGRVVFVLENILRKYIEVFEEGYQIRSLNSYQFEDINDFDVDYNSSIQQLLTTYNTLLPEIGSFFYAENVHFGPVVQLNFSNTVANLISVNYNVYHLTSPEFVFSTLVKELLNPQADFTYKTDNEPDFYKDLKKLFDLGIDKESFLKQLASKDLIDFNYLYIDLNRIVFTYNLDISLYIYWFWTYNLQSSPMYDFTGSFNNNHFQKELARLLFVVNVFDRHMASRLECPIADLQGPWNEYFTRINLAITSFLNDNSDLRDKIIYNLGLFIEQHFNYNNEEYEKYEPSYKNKTECNAFLMSLKPVNFEVDPHFLLVKRFEYFNSLYYFYTTQKKSFIVKDTQNGFNKSQLYINSLMYSYLRLLYEQNGRKIHFLRRRSDTGLPFPELSPNEKYLFHIDKWGGLFFALKDRQELYFKQRNNVLQALWHYAHLVKRNQIDKAVKSSHSIIV